MPHHTTRAMKTLAIIFLLGSSLASQAAPTVNLTAPAANTIAIAPGSFTLTASASSANSSIDKVEFYANNGTTNTLVGLTTTAPYNYTWSNVSAGSYSLTAVATDNLNATTTSSAVTVSVNSSIAQLYYIHTDHLDTPRQITDTAGSVVWDWPNLDPFGNNEPNENPSGLGTFEFPIRFKGQTHDKETGLNQNHFRDYDSAIGAYKEFDLIGLRGGLNGYIYVRGNPLSRVDSLGLYDSSPTGPYLPSNPPYPPLPPEPGLENVCVECLIIPAARIPRLIQKVKNWCEKDNSQSLWPGDDPTQAPPGTEWRGRPDSKPGSDEGNYYNPNTGESYRPDLNHPDPIGPHWDYRAPDGTWSRIYPDGTVVPK